eukprot:gene19563-biopygen16062
MGLETAGLHRNDHVWCPGGSGQALGRNPCLYIFFIPAAASRWEGQECGGCNMAHPFMCALFLNRITHVTSRRVHVPGAGALARGLVVPGRGPGVSRGASKAAAFLGPGGQKIEKKLTMCLRTQI